MTNIGYVAHHWEDGGVDHPLKWRGKRLKMDLEWAEETNWKAHAKVGYNQAIDGACRGDLRKISKGKFEEGKREMQRGKWDRNKAKANDNQPNEGTQPTANCKNCVFYSKIKGRRTGQFCAPMGQICWCQSNRKRRLAKQNLAQFLFALISWYNYQECGATFKGSCRPTFHHPKGQRWLQHGNAQVANCDGAWKRQSINWMAFKNLGKFFFGPAATTM
jgi:hypothetical protein